MLNRLGLALITAALVWTPARAARPATDLAVISAMRAEGLEASQVMDHLSWLADVYGPRETGSSALRAASDWALKRMTGWGLTGGHVEPYRFGVGWTLERSAILMTAPQPMQIIGYPMGWSPGTGGPVTAEVVHAELQQPADLDRWRGKLRGKVVLIQPLRPVRPVELPLMHRFTDEELRRLRDNVPIGWQWKAGEHGDGSSGTLAPTPGAPLGLYGVGEAVATNAWHDRLLAFLKSEGVVAVFERGSDTTERPAVARQELLTSQRTQRIDGGTVMIPMAGDLSPAARERMTPWLVIAVEQYNRMVRILDHGVPVKVELDVRVGWRPEPPEGGGLNTVAEIRGSDRTDEVVMLGAHLDGIPGGTAAIDDAAGVAVVMEAMRLLKAAGARPRRTIRVAFWSGEENGLRGSRAYVERHFGDPFRGPPYTREAEKLSVYFNLDGGSGRIRGFYARNNLAARPVVERWMEPLADLGVGTLSMMAPPSAINEGQIVSSSDHIYFDAVGIPTLEAIQDRLEYFSRTYHSNMDFLDRASKPDLVQAAVVMAVMAYQAANDEAPLPRRAPGPPLRATSPP